VLDTERGMVLSIDEASTALDPLTARLASEDPLIARLSPSEPPAGVLRQPLLSEPSASLDAFAPEEPVRKRRPAHELTRDIEASHWRAPEAPTVSRRAISAALIALAIVQAGVIAFMLRTNVRTPAAAMPEVLPAALPVPAAPTLAAPPLPAPAPAATVGRLAVSTSPPGASVAIDGRRRGVSPLTIDELSAGSHRVQVDSRGTVVEQTVTIDAGATTSLVVPIAQPGWIDVSAPIGIEVLENGQVLTRSSSGPLALKPGTHSLQLRNEALGYDESLSVTIVGGELARITPTLPDGVLQVNALPWAHVWLDGRPVGDTPLGTLKAAVGPHELRFEHPDHGEQVRKITVSALTPTRVSVDFR
jgi:hypothetical protein